MCTILKIPRNTYYYVSKLNDTSSDEYTTDVIKFFTENRRAYGTRRIKKTLATQRKVLSRRRIAKIMRRLRQSSMIYRRLVYSTDRGNKFKNNAIDGLLDTFAI